MPTVTIGENTGDDFSGSEDVYLKQTAATTNQDADDHLDISKFGAGDHNHSLIKFSGLSNITGPVTVSAATLFLFQKAGGSGTYTVEVRRLLRNWVEGEATWNVFSTGNNWTTAGGLSNGNDRVATVSGSLSMDTTSQYFGITGSQLAQDVQDIINGVNSNFGWHCQRQDAGEDSNFKTFVDSESTDGQRPYLEVTYSPAGALSVGSMFFFPVWGDSE